MKCFERIANRFNPNVERMYVGRDIDFDGSHIYDQEYFSLLRDELAESAVNIPHVSVLNQYSLRKIRDAYPNDDTYELMLDALGELQLPAVAYGHLTKAEVYRGRPVKGRQSYWITLAMDKEGGRRIRDDSFKILGYFGITGVKIDAKPHVSFAKITDDKCYANYICSNLNSALKGSEAVEFQHTVVDRLITRPWLMDA